MGRWTTPNLLRVALAGCGIGAFLLFAVVALAVSQRRTALKTIGTDSAPSILAAQSIRAYLADMDANAANELVAKPGQNMDAVHTYSARRLKVTDSLITAAQNITFGDAERKPLVTLENGLADYERAMTQARDFHERGDPAMLAAYRQADDILHKTLFPAVDALDKVNNDALTTEYAGQNAGALASFLLTLLAGGLLLAVQISTQLFLTRRMRRTFNPALLAATVLTAWYLLHTLSSFTTVKNHIKVAKEDAFDSVRALWQTRAVAYDANADESRWLLDRPQASNYAGDFHDKAIKISSLPAGGADAVAQTYLNNQKSTTFKGLLADELNNITFPGEREAAVAALQSWERYLAIDTKLRALENAGKHSEAIALCIGNDPGESNWAYNQFDTALDKTLEINQKEFDQNMKAGTALLQSYDLLNPAILLFSIVLTVAGLMPRLREYAF